MSRDPDLEELARRYLDLWQDQVTALANDAEMAEALERFLALPGMVGPYGGPFGGGAPGAGSTQGAAAPWLQWPATMMAAMGATAKGAGTAVPEGFEPGEQAGSGGVSSATEKTWDIGNGRAAGRSSAGTDGAAGPGGGEQERSDASGSGEATGAASAAAASGNRPGDLEHLMRRIAALEERLAALESSTGSGDGKPSGRDRKRRS